jgi:hypothetical protein
MSYCGSLLVFSGGDGDDGKISLVFDVCKKWREGKS